MLAGLLRWALVLGPPLVLGALLLGALGIGPRRDRLAYWGWAWTAGALSLAATLFLHLSFGGSLSLAPLLAELAFLGLVLGWLARRELRGGCAAPEPPDVRGTAAGRAFFALAVAVSVAIVLGHALWSAALPVVRGDEVTIWAAKAKALVRAGAFDATFGSLGRSQDVSHADYPLLNPLLQSWVMTVRGALLHLENRVPIQLCMLAIVLVLASSLRRVAGPVLAGLLLFLLVGCRRTVFLSQYAYADHMVALGALVALDGWLRFRRTGDARWWRLSCVGQAFALWSKNDAYLLLVAVAAAGLVARFAGRRRRDGAPLARRELAFLALPAGIALAQALHNRAFGFANDLMGGSGSPPLYVLFFTQFAERAGLVASLMAENLAWKPATPFPYDPQIGWFALRRADGNLLALVLLFVIVVCPRRTLRGEWLVPGLAFLLALLGMFAVYVGSYHGSVNWHIQTSFTRVLYDVMPGATVLLAAALEALVASLRAREPAGSPAAPG